MASLYEAILLEDVPKEEEVMTDEILPTSLSFDENIIRDSQYNSLKEEDERLAPDALVLQNVREQLKSLEITDNFNASANAILSQITDNVIGKSHLRESLERYINDQIHERFQSKGEKEERKVLKIEEKVTTTRLNHSGMKAPKRMPRTRPRPPSPLRRTAPPTSAPS